MNVSILTPFTDFNPAYSLSHVVADQTRCLIEHGHDVQTVVCLSFHGDAPMSVTKCLPLPDERNISTISDALHSCLRSSDVVFTHDWISHPRFKPYLLALREFSRTDTRIRWYHWIHSVPALQQDHWDMNELPDNHMIVYPTNTDMPLAAAQFRTIPDRVLVIPDIADLRWLLDFSPEAQRIVDATPGLVSAEFVEVYPAAADRFISKGIHHLIKVMSAIKDEGHSVCCLVVDSWSGTYAREDKLKYRELAEKLGLSTDEFVFASDIIHDFRCLSRTDTFKLQMFSNVFVFPTVGEAFGLVMAEAMLTKAYPVPNGSVPSLREVCSNRGYYPRFANGKHLKRTDPQECAQEIIERVKKDVAIGGFDSVRRHLNSDSIYERCYKPLMEGAHQ